MKILALDTSGLVASAAVMQDDVLIAEFTVCYKKTHSQTLLPMLAQIRESIELDLDSLDAVAVASGPGSFTGLRIGAATAKGLGLALEKPLVEVPTLEGLSYHFWGSASLVCPLMDARRGQVYAGIYAFEKQGDDWELKSIEPGSAVEVNRMIEKVNALGREVIFLGDGVPVYAERIRQWAAVPHSFAPPHKNRQSAACVAALGARYYTRGRYVTAAQHSPQYFRVSQAERSRNADG
ncbi:MAG: tRNA (adenosine(37)-N6)-threonylcarbamoyltransferase complex dimerization subunit type 1 TsaB [Clostridium sp.]|jgi:tRNA threonylcarbamoyl adenosine modification protein YeaZ|nr:tRNA (adenosine(37)-N6)-threonylcarbamoyltransferase complex dimerization subunit type 1 TsaB [Clostridium sp.]